MQRLRTRTLAGLLALAMTVAAPSAAQAGQQPPNAYVALGDSFTAAPLVPSPTGDPYDCGRSTRNYPHLVQAQLQAPVFRDVSCGGARTKHFSEPQDGLPFGGTNPPQYDALGPDVALVTIGIGGNDIGFGGIVDQCVQPPPEAGGTPCRDHYQRDGGDELHDRIAETAPVIAQMLLDVQRLAPNAAIFLVGYPALLPDEGDGCYPYVPVLPEDVHYLRGVQKALNAMLKTQAEAHGATYVDWYTPSIGHDACQPPPFAWTNGAVIVPPSFPAHPNQFGTEGAAIEVLAALEATGFGFPTEPVGAAGNAPSGSGDAAVLAAADRTAASGPASLPATGAAADGRVALAFALAIVGAAGPVVRRRLRTVAH